MKNFKINQNGKTFDEMFGVDLEELLKVFQKSVDKLSHVDNKADFVVQLAKDFSKEELALVCIIFAETVTQLLNEMENINKSYITSHKIAEA